MIGLVGGIGAGKSVVARTFEALGAGVVDSDRLNHELLGEPDTVARLKQWWGDSVLTDSGRIDRKALAAVVFAEPRELRRLEEFIYPLIADRRAALVVRYDADNAVRAIVLDSPKLLESGLDRQCDTVVFVDTDRKTRVERLRRSRGWTEEELTGREKLLNPLDSKRSAADHVIDNNSSLQRLESSVELVLSSVIASFSP